MRKDPYEVLGITSSATPEEVKRAYRRKVRECHPDAVGSGKEAEFIRVQEAYDALGRKARRARGTRAQSSAAPSPRDTARRTLEPELELELTPREAREGCTLRYRILVDVPCPACRGLGLLSLMCPWCGGWGHTEAHATVTLRVRPGTRDGDVLFGHGWVGGVEVGVPFEVRVAPGPSL